MNYRSVLTVLALAALLPAGFAHAQYFGQTGSAPAAVTHVPQSVGATAALLSGTVNPNGSQATAWFEYGPSGSLGSRTSPQGVGAGSAAVNFAAPVNDLQPNTAYSYRLAAQNAYGIQYGSVQTFYTSGSQQPGVPGGAFSAETGAASEIDSNSATLYGTVTTGGSDVTAWFEYGRTSSLGTVSPSRLLSGAQSSVQVRLLHSGLRAGTTYYYRIAAQGPYGGIVRGQTLSFRTTGTAPAPAPGPAAPSQPTSTAPTSTPPSSVIPATLTASVDNVEPARGQEFDYSLRYKNNASNALQNVSLSVTLPAELEYVMADVVPNIQGNMLVFSPGVLEGNSEKTITIKLKPKADAPVGASVPLSATLSYTDSGDGRQKTATANLSLAVREGSRQTANLGDSLGGLRWFRLIIGLLAIAIVLGALYIYYRYRKSKKAFSNM